MRPASLTSRRPARLLPGAGIVLAAGLLLLAGCSRGGDSQARHATAGKASSASQAADPTADMVGAVTSASGKSPVGLKFRLGDLPRVGVPLQVELAVLPEPKLEITKLKVALSPREGLELRGAAAIDLPNPLDGEVLWTTATLVPQQPGVLSLAVTLLVDTEHESTARTYTVPLIVPATEIQPVATAPHAAH